MGLFCAQNQIAPEFDGDQFCHVAAESVHALVRPEADNGEQAVPVVAVRIVDLVGIAPVVVVAVKGLDAAVRICVIEGDMVGDEVDNHLEPGSVSPPHELLELKESFVFVISKIRIDIIVV